MRDIVSDDPACGVGICWKNVMDMWNYFSKSHGRKKKMSEVIIFYRQCNWFINLEKVVNNQVIVLLNFVNFVTLTATGSVILFFFLVE